MGVDGRVGRVGMQSRIRTGITLFSTQALRKAVAQVDDNKLDTERAGGTYDRILVYLNALGGVMFILGVSVASMFVFSNVR